MFEIFHHYENKVYKTEIWTCTLAFFIFSAVILFSLPILVVLQTRDLWTITTSRWGQLDECRILIDQSAVLVYTSHAGQPAVFTWSGSQLHLYDENANPPITNRYLSGTLETVTENEVTLRPIRLAGTIVQKKLDLLFNLYPGVNRTVLGIQTFLPLHCRMVAEDQRQINIRGLIYENSFGQSGYKSLTISGKLVVHQTQPFPTYFKEGGGEINAAFPLDNMNFVVPTGKEIESILYSLSRTNFTAQLTETVKMATYGSRPNSDVLPIRIIVRLSRQELIFQTPAVYQFKWDYIRYLSIWIILIWPISKLWRYTFERHLLSDNQEFYTRPLCVDKNC